jgi:hypothetical protein
VKPKPQVPFWRWAFWGLELAVGMLVFYVVLTPIWIGIRVLAWAAEFRARRRGSRRSAARAST